MELRKSLLLPLDDLLAVVHEFMNEEVSRSGLDRCLRRHGVSNLKSLYPVVEEEKASAVKTFKDYEPGFIHIDIKQLPRMPDEFKHCYLYVGIDRATRWVHLDVFPDKEACTAAAFLKRLLERIPFIVKKVLTDNGKEFTDRFSVNGERAPTEHHIFDQVCQRYKIEHHLIPPHHPQTNGMVERFNGRVEEILQKTKFNSGDELEETLIRYSHIYNNFIPQKALGHVAPMEAIKNWKQKRRNLFKKVADNHPGLDRSDFID
ncbi:transposase [Gammaproteobacteria bacterium]